MQYTCAILIYIDTINIYRYINVHVYIDILIYMCNTHTYRCLKQRRMKHPHNPHLARTLGWGGGNVYDMVVSVAHQYPGTPIYAKYCLIVERERARERASERARARARGRQGGREKERERERERERVVNRLSPELNLN
jgi:hypothetical protein